MTSPESAPAPLLLDAPALLPDAPMAGDDTDDPLPAGPDALFRPALLEIEGLLDATRWSSALSASARRRSASARVLTCPLSRSELLGPQARSRPTRTARPKTIVVIRVTYGLRASRQSDDEQSARVHATKRDSAPLAACRVLESCVCDAPTYWTNGGNQIEKANVSLRSPRKSVPSFCFRKRR